MEMLLSKRDTASEKREFKPNQNVLLPSPPPLSINITFEVLRSQANSRMLEIATKDSQKACHEKQYTRKNCIAMERKSPDIKSDGMPPVTFHSKASMSIVAIMPGWKMGAPLFGGRPWSLKGVPTERPAASTREIQLIPSFLAARHFINSKESKCQLTRLMKYSLGYWLQICVSAAARVGCPWMWDEDGMLR